LWGRGFYFSSSAQYSEKYSFKSGGKKYLLLVSVITGNSSFKECSEKTKEMKEPPVWYTTKDTDQPVRFDSVYGMRHGTSTENGTWIFVQYYPGRAYPCYVIEYT